MQYVWVILLFLPSALSESTGRFRVVVPGAPVSSVSGSDVVLSCFVRDVDHQNIMINAVDLNVTWSRSDLKDSLVHLYGNHEDLNTDQIPSYRGRTAVFKEELKNGNVSLKLSNVQISDEGEYRCRVDSKHWDNSKTIKLSFKEFVPNPWIIVGITIGVLLFVGVPAGVGFYIYKVKRKEEDEINEVKSLLNSNKDGRLQHHNLSPRQWDYVEDALLKSKEEREEFILSKFDPSDRGVEKLKKVIASSEKALLKQCKLTEKSCEVLASVLRSENSLTELDLSLNKRQDSGVKKLFEGLKSSHCKLQILRLGHCGLTGESCAVLAEVLKSENSLIELNLSENFELKDSGVKNLCVGLKDEKCKLEKLRLEDCFLTEESCADLAKVLKLENSKLIELNLSKNPGLKDSGVKKLCDELKNEHCKLQILRLEHCGLKEVSCADLASVLKLEKSKLIELNLSKNMELKDSGVKNLCEGLKNKNSKLQILRLEFCDLTEKSCSDLASVLKSENSKLIELNLSQNKGLNLSGVDKLCDGLKDKNCKLQKLWLEQCDLGEESCKHLVEVLKSENSKLIELNLSKNMGLKDSGVENLCDGLKDKNCKLQKLWLEFCDLTEKSCAVLASVLKSENSKLIELNLSQNRRLKDSGVKNLCDGLKNEHCKLQILRLEQCDLGEKSCKNLAEVLKSENSKLIELNLRNNTGLKDSAVKNLCDGLKDKNCKLQKLWLAECSIKNEGFTALASALKGNPSSPLEELDLSGNEILETELKLFSELKDTLPNLKVKLAGCSNTDKGCAALASENPPLPSEEQDLRDNGLKESEQKLLSEPNDTFV